MVKINGYNRREFLPRPAMKICHELSRNSKGTHHFSELKPLHLRNIEVRGRDWQERKQKGRVKGQPCCQEVMESDFLQNWRKGKRKGSSGKGELGDAKEERQESTASKGDFFVGEEERGWTTLK